MKKTIIFFLLILSINIFAKEYKPYLNLNPKNPNKKTLVFTGQVKNSKKIISIYQENEKLIYVYGLEGKKAELIIIGIADKNLFKNGNETTLGRENFILFKNKNYTYLISFYDNYERGDKFYNLTVFKDEKPISNLELDNLTTSDFLFETDIFTKLPYDESELVAEYITYD